MLTVLLSNLAFVGMCWCEIHPECLTCCLARVNSCVCENLNALELIYVHVQGQPVDPEPVLAAHEADSVLLLINN